MPSSKHSGHSGNFVGTSVTPDESAKVRCAYTKVYEEMQDLRRACSELGDFWQGVGFEPNVDGLSDRWAAEVYMRAGALTGWRGSADKVEGAQECAKNLLTKSEGMFHALSEDSKVAEVAIELGVCYMREVA